MYVEDLETTNRKWVVVVDVVVAGCAAPADADVAAVCPRGMHAVAAGRGPFVAPTCLRFHQTCTQTPGTCRLVAKGADLVRSYWPLMSRLRAVEAELAGNRKETASALAARDEMQAQVRPGGLGVLTALCRCVVGWVCSYVVLTAQGTVVSRIPKACARLT